MDINGFRSLIRNYLKENLTIQELSPAMASRVLDKRYTDKRAERIHPEAVKMVFRDYIGKNFPWYMKVRNENQPHRYQLIDVRWRRRQETNEKYPWNGNYTIQFDFHTDGLENGTGADAPYSDYKQQFTLTYSVNNDQILNDENSDAKAYVYNRAFINAILSMINLSRQLFNKEINSKDVLIATDPISIRAGQTINPGEHIPDELRSHFLNHPHVQYKREIGEVKPTHYAVGMFKTFDYSSNNIKYQN